MIFAGQENPLIIFKSKEIYTYQNKYQNPHKFPEIMKKNMVLVGLILECTLTTGVFSFLCTFIMCGAFE